MRINKLNNPIKLKNKVNSVMENLLECEHHQQLGNMYVLEALRQGQPRQGN